MPGSLSLGPPPYLLTNNARLRHSYQVGRAPWLYARPRFHLSPSSPGFYLYFLIWISWCGFSFCRLQLRVLTYTGAQKFCSLFSRYSWTSWRNPSLKLYPWSSNVGPLFKAILALCEREPPPRETLVIINFHLVAFMYLTDHMQLL